MDLDVTSFTFVITNSMEQSPSSEANRSSVKEFPAFYGTRSHITAFTTAHLSLSWTRSNQSTLSSHVLKNHF